MLVDSAETNSVYASPWGVVVRLRDFIAAGWERALEGLAPLTYSGAALFSPSLFERLPRQGKCSLITVLIELMRERPGSVRAWVPQEVWWSDLGNAASYLAVHEACFGPSPPPLKEFDAVPLGCSAAPLQSTDASSRNLGRPRGSILLGKGSVVEEGASVEGFLVAGENCIVGKGTRLRNCVLWDGTAVRGLAAENSIIDGDVVVRA
jgi:NDP-sugar pyrophosphorylase family protein